MNSVAWEILKKNQCQSVNIIKKLSLFYFIYKTDKLTSRFIAAFMYSGQVEKFLYCLELPLFAENVV